MSPAVAMSVRVEQWLQRQTLFTAALEEHRARLDAFERRIAVCPPVALGQRIVAHAERMNREG